MGGFSEYNERALQDAEIAASTVGVSEEQMLLDYLIEMGFVWEEAAKLLNLRDHLYENAEMRQRMAEDHRMLFARWLYEQGEITEV
ncbi:MAG TPA: hypothetical protein VK140_14455 [Ktedonobacteraceae bacterium]|nr:hypothetical protein [Ktedonobacteraceae bacterium]